MTVTKSGFILSYLKYNDVSAIVKIFERENGIESYFIKNIYLRQNKKKSYLSPLMGIDFTASESQKGLPQITKISVSDSTKELEYSIINNAQMMLAAEFIAKVIPYGEPNGIVYDLLSEYCKNLSQNNALAFYLYKIIKYLGYGFDFSDAVYFDAKNGIFTNESSTFTLGEELSQIIRSIDDFSFLNMGLKNTHRKKIIDILMDYCGHHIADFTSPKSLEILRQIL